jgi:hypothetical protein
MTTASGVPVHPRLGARLAYRMQRALRPQASFRWLSARIEADLRLLHRPIDHRRWGQSSSLSYWQGRDEGLWTPGADGPAAGPGAQR